ncbi:HEAT repeat domain-containing protein, partial [bacterium]|nr:HEAT repeat domain-containing protein [bacterium]
ATDDHYLGLRTQLGLVAGMLESEGFRAEVLADDSRLVDRAAAVRAGVGWWGKNAMVLAPGAGPWMLLGSVVTDAPLPVSEPQDRTCGTCSACLPACPTGALVAPGVLDARLCLARWLQAPGVIPAEMRAAVGDRVYGCDDCLDACPPGGRLMDSSTDRQGTVDLIELLSSADRTLLERFDHWYVPRRQARHIRRNALIALGNSADRSSVGVVAGYLGHPDWLVRAHAAWALGRLGGPWAGAALGARAAGERDARVAAEIEAARSTLA